MQKTLENLSLEEIDQSNAVLFIHYDPDTKMIYLAGKVRYITVNRGQGWNVFPAYQMFYVALYQGEKFS